MESSFGEPIEITALEADSIPWIPQIILPTDTQQTPSMLPILFLKLSTDLYKSSQPNSPKTLHLSLPILGHLHVFLAHPVATFATS